MNKEYRISIKNVSKNKNILIDAFLPPVDIYAPENSDGTYFKGASYKTLLTLWYREAKMSFLAHEKFKGFDPVAEVGKNLDRSLKNCDAGKFENYINIGKGIISNARKMKYKEDKYINLYLVFDGFCWEWQTQYDACIHGSKHLGGTAIKPNSVTWVDKDSPEISEHGIYVDANGDYSVAANIEVHQQLKNLRASKNDVRNNIMNQIYIVHSDFELRRMDEEHPDSVLVHLEDFEEFKLPEYYNDFHENGVVDLNFWKEEFRKICKEHADSIQQIVDEYKKMDADGRLVIFCGCGIQKACHCNLLKNELVNAIMRK